MHFCNDRGTVTIKGMVSQDPDVREKTSRLYLQASEIKLDGGWQEVQGNTLLFVPRYTSYSYGDILLVTGEPETPPSFSDFDYQGYLAHQGIYTTMLYPEIEVLDTGQGFKPLEWLYSLRNQMSQGLAEALAEPQAALAQGITLGIRGNIPSQVKADFSHSGTAHLLAISGLHLSIVAGILLSLGIWLFGRRRYTYIWLALAVIWLYVLITGMQPPVVRAAIMASLFLAAELLGRQRSAITALTLAAAIMVALNPQILWSASFQMSFLAMAGLVFVFPRLRDIGRRVIKGTLGENRKMTPAAYFVSDSFSVTLAALIGVWPLVAYYFGIVSLVAPLATLLALPALPGIIILGALTGVLGIVALSIAQVVGWLAWLFLSYLLLITQGLASLPLSAIEVTGFSSSLVWGYYLALGLSLWLLSRRRRESDLASRPPAKIGGFAAKARLKWLVPALLVLSILASVVTANMPDGRLHVSFLDVGQGDAILIQTPAHQDILVDGGPSPQAISLELSRKMPFWDRTIDLVVLTHPQADHLTGLIEVLQRYRVKQVLYPDLDYDSLLYQEWLRLIEERDIKATIARAGQQIDLGGGLVIEVLSPPSPLLTSTDSDVDNNGVVLSITMGKVSFLLTSDIHLEAEFGLINQRAVPESTVLKIAHHGSATSTTAQFLAVASPQLVVISVGADNKFGHPEEGVIARLEEILGPENILRTDEQGTIEFITDGVRLWVVLARADNT